ncbi:MAG: hypothetical protein OXC48_03470, partial [Endozoicomonadaceae bacterium]|nr:hypothetical protein [Endozoicomonadaceae bacterium]
MDAILTRKTSENIFFNQTIIFLCLILLFSCQKVICKTLPPSFHNINLNNKQSDIIIKKSHTSNDHKKNNTLLHSKNIVKKNIVLNAQSSSSEPWSNAFNFKKTWGTQVDPRTGTLTAYVKVGSMISNLNHGPNINLQVSYSSSSKANIDGLGVGWRWNLAHFNPATNQLATSQGQIFNLQETKDGTWQPRYHKLHDIQITGNKKTNFVITYSNGLREILNNDGFETRLEQQNGYGVTFNYVSGTNLLSNICDDQGHKIVLTRKAGSLIITSDDTYGKPVSIWLHYLNDELRSISLSGADNNNSSMNIYIQYDGHLLNNISYPSGLQKNITYDCDSEMPVESYSYDQHYLCVVSQESTDPGANQPEMTVNYSYGKSNANEHNYLGFNSGLSTIPGLSTDVLFAAPTNYTYTTKQDNGTITQIHTYNKYHLLINVQLISDRTGHLLSSVHNFFCRTDEYDGCANTSFTDLPVTYSLPLKVVTKIWGEYSESPAVETIEHSYDMYGRLTSTTDSYGRKQIITYCPASGNAACPAEPPKWSLSTMVQSVIMQPADTLSAPPTKPLTIQSFYQKMPNITGSDYILVPKLKIVSSNNQKIVTTRQYYDNKKDPFEYGLLKTIKVTGTLSSDKTLTSVTKNYYYILGTDKTTRTTYSTIKISANQFSRSPAKTISMFTNQVLKITDPENKDIVYYHYDKQGRMIQTDSGAGTAFLVSKYYQYKISPQQVQLTIINSNGVQKKIIFDGLGRALTLLREAISTSGKAEPGKWILAKKRAYDSGGHVISKQNYYTDASNNLHYLTTTFDYDDLGRLIRKHLPDHETLVKEYDDLDRCVVNFRYDSKMVHSAIIVTHSNILDKPVRQSVFPANFINSNAITAISLCEISDIPPVARTSLVAYDGFGRAIKFTDQKGRVVTENYDALGHVTDIINPAGDKIHNVYNLTGQLVQKWIIPANNGKQTSKKYLLDSAQYNAAGKLLWKAGEDGKKTTYTYTADGQIATMTTPAGHILSWQYNDIGLPVNETIDNKQLLHTDYNPVTGLPFKKTDITGTSTWTYSDDGKIEQIQHIGANSYPNYSFQWQYDNNRRITSVTDQFGNKRSISYDALGRISSASYQKVNGTTLQIFKPFYNGFSKIVKAIYGSGMIRNIHYNNYNKVDDVYDTLAGKQLAEWKYTYDKTGNIVSMVHNTGEQQQAILHYQYDILNNLTTMSCSGSTGLPLCPRDTSLHGSNLQHAPIIISQHYFFNSLNRMTQVKEQLLDTDGKKTSSKVVNYGYGDEQAPLRLQQISIAWNDNAEQTTHFTYDATGNMMIDSSGNRMTYNAFNQITSVVNPEGKKTNYYYDGSGREIREKDATDDIRTMFYVGKT